MRVGIHAPGHLPEMGGGHTYTSELLAALARSQANAKHHLVAIGHGPTPPEGWEPSSYMSLAAPLPVRVAGRLRMSAASILRGDSPSRVDRALLARDLDLVWCLSQGTPSFALPYVTTIWDIQHRRQPVFPEVGAGYEWLGREVTFGREIQQASIVVVGNEAGQAEVERFYGVPSERIRRLPHPTPEFALRGAANAADGQGDTVLSKYKLEPGYVLYPAQFWAHKNHVALVKALRRLRDDYDADLELVFVGSDKGNETYVLQVERDLGVADHIHHLGFVPQVDLISLYRGALALGYVSFFGPENLPPLEAFALGCPVVAADVAGSHEQLADAALLVPPTDDAAIAHAVSRILHEPELRDQLVSRGRERARSFTVPDYVEGMMRVMDELEPVIRTWR